ncbi:urease accessory protein UreE [Gordonia sp. 852002-50816_SCH5313054-c]|uniref:urease accessory protein UreE n=1 Tax=unclassified Gordonia (in: high G+C Gram-positive bacteria) TaxID=2657482 RepID=UPI0007E94F40|nr:MULTISPECIES: urease accessory protein UreE [unclassified Gordonia (in: high G+C Gram-positive bacteria)]OBC07904.1 urease accessory protein UreE [Gordonia sp. 852002-50816_SCH5313054-a]OBC15689.1 urease accessory protein UreE [Gordonia sp. 852002-50816_SCH5313054-c]
MKTNCGSTTTGPLEVTELLGDVHDARLEGREIVYVEVEWGDARKHRQVLIAEDGTEMQVRLARGSYLADGLVVADDGQRVIAVRRPAQAAVRVDFAANAGPDGARRLLLLGYLLGNQHAPLDVTASRLATPLMTSAAAANEVLASLHIEGEVTDVVLAAHGWTNTSSDHHGAHSHGHSDHSHG